MTTRSVPSEVIASQFNKLVLQTPILHEANIARAHILLTPHFIDRIMDHTLTEEIDRYEPSDTKADAAEAWLGRFATDELWDAGYGAPGWAALFNRKVTSLDSVGPDRTLPFLVPVDRQSGFIVSTLETNPDIVEMEREFTPRALTFLIEKGLWHQ